MSRPFQFKSFAINQDKAPMKVGTDGVLLGAWCSCLQARTALDIGTGTGLIALMLVQRSQELIVTAIEPNTDALADATQNIEASLWSNRIKLIETQIEHFSTSDKFDLIVSNPPFFHGDLKAPNLGREMARHAEGFDYLTLLSASKLLNENGILSGIYPTEIFEKIAAKAENFNLFLQRKCEVRPTPDKKPHRILFEFSFNKNGSQNTEQIVIESDGRHQYSEAYKKLTKDFYLKF